MKQPIRILQVFKGMNMGGAETMIMNIYRNVDRSIIQFDFIVHTSNKCYYDDEILSMGGKIYRAPRFNVKNYWKYVKWWKCFFNEHQDYKIIHGHVRSSASIYLSLAKRRGLTTLIHSHSMSSGTKYATLFKNILRYPIISAADYLFACSTNAGEWLYGKKACLKNKFKILNNAIDVEKYAFDNYEREQLRKEMNIDEKLVIGHVGSFRTPKNHDFLVNIFKVILDREPNALLLLVGDGELKEKIKDKVKRLNIAENVIFTGVRSDIPELLSVMDILVFPSLWEGLPVTLIEAQASGLPCVISDVITDEVLLTPHVQSVSLLKSPEHWANLILSMDTTNREYYSKFIIESGFDIKETATKLTKFYLNNW